MHDVAQIIDFLRSNTGVSWKAEILQDKYNLNAEWKVHMSLEFLLHCISIAYTALPLRPLRFSLAWLPIYFGT